MNGVLPARIIPVLAAAAVCIALPSARGQQTPPTWPPAENVAYPTTVAYPTAADLADPITAPSAPDGGHRMVSTGIYNADQASMAEKLARLEQWQQEVLDKEAAAKKKAAGAPTLEIHGRIHLDSWSFTHDSEGIHFFENPVTGADPENRVFFRRIRLRFQGDVIENMVYRMQIDFNTPDSGEMKDVYIGFTDLPLLQTLLIGNQKRPLGLDHLNSSRFNVFIERPLVVEAFNEDARRLGVASYGVSQDESFNWSYGVYALENPTLDGKAIGDTLQPSFNLRLTGSPWYDHACDGRGYFHWAVAGMFAWPDGDPSPIDTNANEGRFRTRAELRSDQRWLDTGAIAGAESYEVLGLEAMFNAGPLQVVGEYQTNWMQRDDATPGDDPDLFFHGGYVFVAYMLTGEHVPYDRRQGVIGRVKPFRNFSLFRHRYGSGWGAWQVALRYSFLDLSDEDIRGGIADNLTFGLVWYLNPHAALQLNAIYGDIDDHEAVAGLTAGHFTALGARFRIDF